MSNGRLANKVSIITGGAGGIGTATGLTFSSEGSHLALVDRDQSELDAARKAILAEIPNATISTHTADLSDEAAAQKAVDEIIEQHGRIDVLVNCAGIRGYDTIEEATWAHWEAIMKVNFLSYTSMTRAALPHLRKSGHGSVVNVSSHNAFYGRAGTGAYDASKAAILAFTRTLAFEEYKHGIRANAVCPGPTRTPFHEKRLGVEKLKADKPEGLMQRWAEPKEIAYPILWLASAEASYVNATELLVDGGYPVGPTMGSDF